MSKFSYWARDSVVGLNILAFILCGIAAGWIVSWYIDSKPPIVMTGYTTTQTHPGGTVRVVMNVKRELQRNCRASYSRRLIDRTGAFIGGESGTHMTAQDIMDIEKRTPGQSIFTVDVPTYALPGELTIATPILYWCNPWHSWIAPLGVSLVVKTEVLAP